jgi:acyl-CoA thioester hydrolase
MDNDVYGHVNNVVDATLIRQGPLDPEASEVIGLVVETGCRYAASLAFPDDVDAGIRVARLGNSSVRYEVGLFRAGEEDAAAEGYFVHVYVDRHTRRPTKLPADLRAFLETL